MKIYADIGGTYARFAQYEEGAFFHIKKYKAAQFETLADALAQYCAEQKRDIGGSISIATAAYDEGNGDWRFVNQNEWIISAQSLEEAGWTLDTILNDFAAGTWGLLTPDTNWTTLHDGETDDNALPKCLIGPGTGLGLGYLIPTPQGPHVQRTHGGHMLATASTDEQALIIKTLQKTNPTQGVVFEHLVSGPGLFNIYTALNLIAGKTSMLKTPEELLDHKDHPIVQNTLRLFHEFFGLFARTVTITGHAYGGLYLTGGVLERLIEYDLFNFDHFHTAMLIGGVESVTQGLNTTPVIHAGTPDLAMKGLHNFEMQNTEQA